MAQGRPLVAILLAGILLYACVAALLWNQDRDVPGSSLLGATGAHPRAVMTSATKKFLGDSGNIAALEILVLKDALSLLPLEDEPFTFSAFELIKDGQLEEAEGLLQVALERNPRSREARILLYDLLVQRGAVPEAIHQGHMLSKLMPQHRRLFLSNMVYLVSNPSTRTDALLAITDPSSQLQVLRGLANSGASASMLIDTYKAFGSPDFGDKKDVEVAALASPLVKARDYNGAFRLWAVFHPEFADRPLSNFVLDPEFTGKIGPPFGWQVFSTRNGYARLGPGGLTGEYYGRRSTRMARQLISLEPGSYTLIAEIFEDRGQFGVSVNCESGARILNERFVNSSEAFDLQIPNSNCDAQEVWILGIPSDPPKVSRLQVAEFVIKKAAP